MTSKHIRKVFFCTVLILSFFHIVARTHHHEHIRSDELKTTNHRNKKHHESSSDLAPLSSPVDDDTGREDPDDGELLTGIPSDLGKKETVKSERECEGGFDWVQFQPATFAYEEDWPEKEQATIKVSQSIKGLGLEARFGLVYYGPYHVAVPLAHPTPDMMESLKAAITGKMNVQTKEGRRSSSAFGALMHNLKSSKMDWRNRTREDQKVGRVAALIVDKAPDLNSRAESAEDGIDDHPSLEDVARIVNAEGVYVVVLAGRGGSIDKSGKFTPHPSLAAKDKKYHGRRGLARLYEDGLEDAGFKNFSVYSLESEKGATQSIYARIGEYMAEEFDAVFSCAARNHHKKEKEGKGLPDTHVDRGEAERES